MIGEAWDSELLRHRVNNSVDLFGSVVLLTSNAELIFQVESLEFMCHNSQELPHPFLLLQVGL